MANCISGVFAHIILLFSLFSICHSARILCYYPVPFVSHQSVLRVLTEELARRGHELVVITTMPHEKPFPNVTEIDVGKVSFDIWEQITQENMNKTQSKIFKWGVIQMWEDEIYPRLIRIVDAQLGTKEVQALVHDGSQKFDVILVEPCTQGSYIITAGFEAPVIAVSSLFGSDHDLRMMGAATHSLFFPDYSLQKTHDYSILDKIINVYYNIVMKYLSWRMESEWDSLSRKHIRADAPPLSELKKRVQMLLMNVHHIWDNNRPVPPSVMYMGALQVKKPKALPKELQSYLDNLTNGFIYMSLGSKIRASDLPKRTIDILFKVFSSIPYNVILKWNAAKPENTPDNVRLMEWIPQNDLLYHPNIKGFITHGGLQSADETIAARVPVIALPVYADQFYNADKYVQFGIGYRFDIDDLDADGLRKAIISIVEEKSYRENIKELSEIMEEQRAGGLEKAVYSIEQTARRGGAGHLRSPLADATPVEQYMLDVTAALLAIVVVTLVSLIYTLRTLRRYYLNTHRKLKSN